MHFNWGKDWKGSGHWNVPFWACFGCGDGVPEAPVLLFNTREGWRVVETPPSHRNVRGVWEWVPEPPLSLFDTRKSWWVVETPLSCQNMRGGCGNGCQSPRFSFQCKGGLEGGWNTSIVLKCERVWGAYQTPVLLFDMREGQWVVETPPSHQNLRGKHGGGSPFHISMPGREGVERWWRNGSGGDDWAGSCHQCCWSTWCRDPYWLVKIQIHELYV